MKLRDETAVTEDRQSSSQLLGNGNQTIPTPRVPSPSPQAGVSHAPLKPGAVDSGRNKRVIPLNGAAGNNYDVNITKRIDTAILQKRKRDSASVTPVGMASTHKPIAQRRPARTKIVLSVSIKLSVPL